MSSRLGFSCFIVFAILFFSSCNKEYYDASDMQYSVIFPDTIYLDSAIVIKGTINQPLDIGVYFQDYREENLIGVLKPYSDSIIWKPTNIPESDHYAFCMRVDYKIKKNHGGIIATSKSVVVKK